MAPARFSECRGRNPAIDFRQDNQCKEFVTNIAGPRGWQAKLANIRRGEKTFDRDKVRIQPKNAGAVAASAPHNPPCGRRSEQFTPIGRAQAFPEPSRSAVVCTAVLGLLLA